MDMTLESLQYTGIDNSLAYECMLNNDWDLLDMAFEAADESTRKNLLGSIKAVAEKVANWIKEQVALLEEKLSSIYENKISKAFQNRITDAQATEIAKSTKAIAEKYRAATNGKLEQGKEILNRMMQTMSQMSDNESTDQKAVPTASVKNENNENLNPNAPTKGTDTSANSSSSNPTPTKDSTFALEDATDVDANISAADGGDIDKFASEVGGAIKEVITFIKSEYERLTKEDGGTLIKDPNTKLGGAGNEVAQHIAECFRTARESANEVEKYSSEFIKLNKQLSAAAGTLASKGNNMNKKKVNLLSKIQRGTSTLSKCIEATIKITLHPYSLIFWASKHNSANGKEDSTPQEPEAQNS